MKINIANPTLALQKTIEVEDEQKLLAFYEKRIGAEVAADMLGDEWAGYVLRITGGNDKQGFPMKQGVLKNGRVKLLFKKGMSCYKERRGGMRKRKSVRGCIVGHDLAILSTIVVKKGNGEIPGLTDSDRPKRLGPKRASRIRSMFDLEKADDVKKFVIRRVVKEGEGGKKGVTKAPKIQRLVTANRLQRKRRVRKTMVKAIRANRDAKKEYAEKIHAYSKAQKDKRAAEVSKKNKRKEKKATA